MSKMLPITAAEYDIVANEIPESVRQRLREAIIALEQRVAREELPAPVGRPVHDNDTVVRRIALLLAEQKGSVLAVCDEVGTFELETVKYHLQDDMILLEITPITEGDGEEWETM